jgi:L-threonylcarbamoyladenylate synthase
MLVIKEESGNAVEIATQALKNNQIICFATETVYAIACDASSDIAVAKLYEIKKRDVKKPIAVFVKDLAMAKKILDFNSIEDKIAQNFMPGMITLILDKKTKATQKLSPKQRISVSPLLNNNENNLGLRIPNHQFCLKLLRNFDGVIAATSANISNQEDSSSFMQVKKYFDNKVDLIIDGGNCQHKMSSTVLRINGDQINILREGLITQNQIINSLWAK